MKIGSNKFILGIFPLLSIIFVYICTPYIGRLPVEIIDKLPYSPYLIFAGAICMSIFFKLHRTSLIAICLTALYAIMHSTYTMPELAIESLATFGIACILLPINIAIISRARDQEILSMHAFLTSSAILAQLVASYWLVKNYSFTLAEWLTFTPQFFEQLIPPNLSLPLILIYSVSAYLITKQIQQKNSVFEIAFIGALAASLFSLQTQPDPQTSSIYMLLAGLILIWGIIHNSYLIAYIDELTDLPGRRAMNEEMARLRGNYAIAMLDIDHFKKFNDSYGHDVGDQVLRMVASKISKIRGGGKPFRYGGEEFAILFPGKDSKATFPFLSNLRETIDAARMVLRNHNRPANKPETSHSRKAPWQEVHVTISIGVANNDNDLSTTTEVLKAADEALYRSKEKGRNRISQYSTGGYGSDLESDAVE